MGTLNLEKISLEKLKHPSRVSAHAVLKLSERVSKILQVNLNVDLFGSFYENSKCFAPDEFDFLIEIPNPGYDYNAKEFSSCAMGKFDTFVKACLLPLLRLNHSI